MLCTLGQPPLGRLQCAAHLHVFSWNQWHTAVMCNAPAAAAPEAPYLYVSTQSVELQQLGIENIPGQASARVVHLNGPEGAVKRNYSSNVVRTAKCVQDGDMMPGLGGDTAPAAT